MKKFNYFNFKDEDDKKNPIIKMLLILLGVLFLMVLVFAIFSIFAGTGVEKDLLAAGKDYYSNNKSSLPSNVGECNTVSLAYLESQELLSATGSFKSCDTTATYVKVCKLDNKKYQYIPVVSCGTKSDTVFGDWKTGTDSNLVTDKSDVKFTYLGQIYSSQTKVYYPGDVTDASSVTALYTSSPSSEYTYQGEAVSNAGKWYKQTTGTSYWNNGAYSSTAPSGYPSKGAEGTAVTTTSLTEPASASYRTISQITLYRSRSIKKASILDFICIDRNLTGTVYSASVCETRDNYNITVGIEYTCDGTNTVTQGSTCSTGDWSSWTTDVCTNSDSTECQTQTGYVYTDRVWQWYVTGTYKSYYPSGSAVASLENTYYTSSPASGYIEDSSTITTAYKYYKLTDSSSGTTGSYVNITDGYVSLDEMISAYNAKGYKVSSLSDIASNKSLKYLVKIQYANRK